MAADVTPRDDPPRPTVGRQVRDVTRAHCCIVGGGPAGVVLALLFARRGIPTVLLEEHEDFERDFRGDTIHPSTMELMDQLGLAERLLALRHTKIHSLTIPTPDGPLEMADFGRLDTPFPYITFMPQSVFLQFIADEGKRYPAFRLVTGAAARELVEEGGVVRGVRYQARDGWHEVRAPLTVGADGRFSRLRRLAGFEPIKTSPPMDVLWFRLPRKPDDPEDAMGRFGRGHFMVEINRFDYWQIAYVIPKGSYRQVHDEGLPALRRSVAELAPELADRVDHLQDWKQVSVLSVESSRLPRWYKAGLLLIGDAAHVMSPVAGVGINYAIQDAVVAANLLSAPLQAGRLRLRDLAAVQRQREWPTRVIQTFQSLLQQRVLAPALDPTASFQPPAFLRFPLVRNLLPRLIGFGVWSVRLKV